MKRLTLFLVLCVCSINMFSQNITATLGTSGSFIIKDGTNIFLTLDQLNGYLTLNSGVIFNGADRFIHNYGSYNTFMGINAGNFAMTGGYNTGMGWNSLNSNTTGHYNTALGLSTLYNNTTGYNNTAVGFKSLTLNTTGNENTASGYGSLFSNTSGNYNTAVGSGSLFFNTTGYENTAVGANSLYSSTTGYQNTAIGVLSLTANTTGFWNVALGHNSLASNTEGYKNTAVGLGSLQINSGGWNNTAIGFTSLFNNTYGSFNTALGMYSLFANILGVDNTAVGYSAGSIITNGTNLTCLGHNAQPTSSTAYNQITLGNNYVTSLRCNVTTITSLSDARDKKNIKDLDLGIDFLMKIKPRLFNWDKREWYENNTSDGSKIQKTPTAGFIAQELDEVQTMRNSEWLNLVLKDNPDKWEATPGNLYPIIVKAIQDLKKENDELLAANDKLKDATVTLTEKLFKFEHTQNMLVAEIEKLKTNNDYDTNVSLGEK